MLICYRIEWEANMDGSKNNQNKLQSHAFLFKILSNPTRLCILCQLAKKEKENVSNLVCCSKKAQSYISQELAKLKNFGIVKSEKIGSEIFYSLSNNDILEIINTICEKGDI